MIEEGFVAFGGVDILYNNEAPRVGCSEELARINALARDI